MRRFLLRVLGQITILFVLLLPFRTGADEELTELVKIPEQVEHIAALPTADLIRLQPCHDRLVDKKYHCCPVNPN